MPGESPRRLSRRRVIQLGAGAVAASFLVPNAAAAHSNERAGWRSYLSRVTGVTGRRLDAVALATQERFSAPMVGFPPYVKPRVGDLVTITDGHPGYRVAALPVCAWYSGTPTRASGATVDINGIVALRSPVWSAKLRGQRVDVCLLDSTLANRQILDIRLAS